MNQQWNVLPTLLTVEFYRFFFQSIHLCSASHFIQDIFLLSLIIELYALKFQRERNIPPIFSYIKKKLPWCFACCRRRSRNDVLCVYSISPQGTSVNAVVPFMHSDSTCILWHTARLGIWKIKKARPSLQMSWHPKANYGVGLEGSCYSAFAAIVQGTHLQTTQDPGNIHLWGALLGAADHVRLHVCAVLSL